MRKIILIIALVVMVGCETAYQKNGWYGGYTDTRLSENVFQVSYKSDGHVDTAKTTEYALLRSAEVTIENGFSYFVIAGSDKGTTNTPIVMPGSAYTVGAGYGATTNFYGGQLLNISQPQIIYTIACFKEKPQSKWLVYDANFIRDSISKKYDIDQAPKRGQ